MIHHSREPFDAPAERLTRRRLFGLIPLPLLTGCTAAVAAAPVASAPAPHPLEGWLIPIPGVGVWTYNPEEEAMELVPRWELEDVCSAPQPEPLTIRVNVIGDQTVIVRTWASEDVRHCRLCEACRTGRIGPEEENCYKLAPGILTADEARLWSEETKGGVR